MLARCCNEATPLPSSLRLNRRAGNYKAAVHVADKARQLKEYNKLQAQEQKLLKQMKD